MKTILLPTAPHDLMQPTLETALRFARSCEAYIEGFALRPPLAEIVSVDMVMGLTWAADERGDAEGEAQARQIFEDFMAGNEVPRDAGSMGKLCWRWNADAPAGDEFVGSHSRIFDVTVLGKPGQRAAGPRMATLEAVLFEGGRPVLIAPEKPPETIGETILIAWNGSTETARTIAYGMPFLALAKRVVVLSVHGGMVPGPSGLEVAQSLVRNGIEAEAIERTAERRLIGETILAAAGELGCDLLIKGAYTQSRLRQMIFGGATSHILGHAGLPVLMSD